MDASKFKSPASSSSTLGYVTIGNESKNTCIPRNESQVNSFSNVVEGQRVADSTRDLFREYFHNSLMCS